MINGGIIRTFYVCIFDPKDKDSVMMFREEMVEEGRSSVPDMEKSSGSRSESNTNRWSHWVPSTEFQIQILKSAISDL
jgi:hypothetical protein